jgi:hypothetical protein
MYFGSQISMKACTIELVPEGHIGSGCKGGTAYFLLLLLLLSVLTFSHAVLLLVLRAFAYGS